MADTGWVTVGSGSNRAGIGTETWTDPGNITSDDASPAVVNLGLGPETSEWLIGQTLGFSVPGGATIDGIETRVERRSDSGVFDCHDAAIRIVLADDSIGSTDKSAVGDWPTNYAQATYGGAADLWGETWGASDVNDADFGTALAVEGEFLDPEVDFMEIKVHFTAAAAASDHTLFFGGNL